MAGPPTNLARLLDLPGAKELIARKAKLLCVAGAWVGPGTKKLLAEWPTAMYRVEGGNDRLPAAMAAALGDRVRLDAEVVAVSHRGSNVRGYVFGRAHSILLVVEALDGLPVFAAC